LSSRLNGFQIVARPIPPDLGGIGRAGFEYSLDFLVLFIKEKEQ
jgi:hypothetical protein